MNRREFIRSMGLLSASSWILSSCHTEEDMIGEPNWVVEGEFNQPLPIPSINPGSELKVQTTSAQMLGNTQTPVLSYRNGSLGNTIKVSKGQTVDIAVQNTLSEPTNIHWHGLIVPEEMDGHPNDLIAGGSSFTYRLPIQQRAGTYWYHPHPHGATARQVFMGLAGMFIVTDSEEQSLGLPSGENEIPLIIQDKRFEGASLDYSPSGDEMMIGYLGEQVVVNGVHSPVATVKAGWYRLRILNGSTARVYNIAFSNGMNFHVIGADGGLLQKPESVFDLMLAPGERADVLVDFSGIGQGQSLNLVSRKFSQYNFQGRQEFAVMKFTIQGTSTASFMLPASLSQFSAISPATAVKTRTFDIAAMGIGMGGMARHTINGKTYDMERVDEVVAAGTTEIWEFDNAAGDEIHPMHIHGVQFQILERLGGRSQLIATEKGWKDTVMVMPGEKVRTIMTFPLYTGVFVMHCHNLEHEDDGMMLNYRIQ